MYNDNVKLILLNENSFALKGQKHQPRVLTRGLKSETYNKRCTEMPFFERFANISIATKQ